MASLLYTKFDCNGERLGLVDYIDRILGTPHPPRVTKKEEELAVQNAIERPVVAIYRNACGRLVCDAADYIRSEIAPIVGILMNSRGTMPGTATVFACNDTGEQK